MLYFHELVRKRRKYLLTLPKEFLEKIGWLRKKDQDKIKVLLNRHEAIIVMSLDQLYGELDDINKYSPLFAKFYKEQMDFMKDRWKPRVV